MLVDGQSFNVKITKKNIEHYQNLGYSVQCKDTITVPPQHLTPGSHQLVNVVCDLCGEIMIKEYREYLRWHTYDIDCCPKCVFYKTKRTIQEQHPNDFDEYIHQIVNKRKKTCLQKYGVEYVSQVPEVKEKRTATFIEKYGETSPLKNPEVYRKLEQTNLQKYGCKNVFESDEIKQKIYNTNLHKYGAQNPFQSAVIKEKIKKVCLQKYGVEYVSQSSEIRQKMIDSMSQNNNTPTSKQQLQVYDMVYKKYPNAELNYPFSICSLDIFICVNDVKIDIEYDGSYWHTDKQKDIERDKFLQSQGFKTLRIRSGHLLPTEQELFDAIDYLINTEHHFKEIILSDWKEGE